MSLKRCCGRNTNWGTLRVSVPPGLSSPVKMCLHDYAPLSMEFFCALEQGSYGVWKSREKFGHFSAWKSMEIFLVCSIFWHAFPYFIQDWYFYFQRGNCHSACIRPGYAIRKSLRPEKVYKFVFKIAWEPCLRHTVVSDFAWHGMTSQLSHKLTLIRNNCVMSFLSCSARIPFEIENPLPAFTSTQLSFWYRAGFRGVKVSTCPGASTVTSREPPG